LKRLLIVYHSGTGGTRSMVRAAAAAARAEPDLQVDVLHAADAGAEDVLAADGYVFATPETLAAISGPMKDFFDRIYYAALERVAGRPYAIIVCAGSDGENAVRQISRIATGLRLKLCAKPLVVCTHAQTPEAILAAKVIGEADLADCAALGATFAAALAMGVY
jgi:multimeric flavodoxin WrbA